MYTFQDHDGVFDERPASERGTYVLRVKDLAQEDKPREKLLRVGPTSMTNPELVAIIFGSGTTKEGVLEMAARVIKDYGERALAGQRDAAKLAKELDIPLVKALQLVACSELGRRFYQKGAGAAPALHTAKDVYRYLKNMEQLSKEHLRGLYLNTHFKLIHDEVISIGTINANIVHPREVFKPAIEYGAAAVIVAHNHPSGVVKPSDADIEVTKQLAAVGSVIGIPLIDHVIIGRGKYASIAVEDV
jgi:DNA repair protein RadC